MRKGSISILPVITIVFSAFILGFFLGRNQEKSEIIVSVSREFSTVPTTVSENRITVPNLTEEIEFPININHADKKELMALPGIGDILAERILAYREENGPFSIPEDLMFVEGIGKKRFEEILDLISVGG